MLPVPEMLTLYLCAFLGLSALAGAHAEQRRNAITNPAHLWPNGRVPYTFHGQIDAYRKVHILSGFKQIMLSTYSNGSPCITFVPRASETDYIEIQFANPSEAGSAVGRRGGKQIVYIVREITQANIVQVMMFVLGVHPEVARPDRNNILDIVTSNIDPAGLHNFDIEANTDTFRQPFDYDTVVMYGPYLAAINPSMPTIKAKYDGYTFGQTVSMSSGDVTLLQHVYKCHLDASHKVDVLGPLLLESHFHFDFGQLTQDAQDDFDWILRQGQSGTSGTGPNADHSSGSGTYALAEARNHHNQVARLITPTMPAGEYCFVLFVYIYGADVNELNVILRNVDGDSVIIGVQATPINQWYHGSATIDSTKSEFTVRIEARIGNGDRGDIAVDDIYLFKGKCIDWY